MFFNILNKFKNKNKTVYIGVSGGVDSAVVAGILKRQGYKVVGCFVRGYAPPGYPCPIEDDKRSAMEVCAHLRIPFIEIDGEKAYKEKVVDYMLKEYAAGRTPNGDVFCNKDVKFGVFYELAMQNGADYIATGHYAQMKEYSTSNKKSLCLAKGLDNTKDQSYFLWNVPIHKLQKTLFLLGGYKKTYVRKLAKRFKLPNMDRPDSMGVCFLGEIDMKRFLKESLVTTEGDVLDTAGNTIGRHDGAVLYTIGERHGFSAVNNTGKPYFVIAKDLENNTITVSNDKNQNLSTDTNDCVYINSVNYLYADIHYDAVYDAVFRYHGEMHKVKIIKDTKDQNRLQLEFVDKEKIPALASGQSAVLYHKEWAILGGILE